jgi:hypothetical protein
MGLKSDVNQLWLSRENVAWRPSQVYLSATGVYTLFSVAGGAIFIMALGGRTTAAPVGAVTVRVTANTINLDVGAVDIGTAGVVGGIFLSSCNVAGTGLSTVGSPVTIATGSGGFLMGTQVAGPGLVACTFAAGTSLTMEWFMVYRKMSPNVTVS